MITSFALQNFRALETAEVAMSRWTILYGGNGAGKSSILDAMNLLSSFITGTAMHRLFPEGVYSLDTQLKNPDSGSLRFEVVHETNPVQPEFNEHLTYAVEFGISGTESTGVTIENLDVDEASRLNAMGNATTQLETAACTDSVAASTIMERHQFCRRYRLEPRSIQKQSPEEMHFIDKQGYGLPSALEHLKQVDRDAYDGLVKDFVELFPDVSTLETVNYGSAEVALEFTTTSQRQLNGAHLSDGQSLALGILFLAHAPHGPRLLLLDEPEVTLTPIVVRDLLGLVDRAFGPDGQILLTTHSPYVMQWGIDHDQQVRQVRPDFGTRSWRDALHLQGIDPSTYHSDTDPIAALQCCALLETYLTG